MPIRMQAAVTTVSISCVPMFTTRNSFALRLSQKPNGSSRIPSISSVGSSEDANCLRYVSSGFPVFTVLSAKSKVNICYSCVRFITSEKFTFC